MVSIISKSREMRFDVSASYNATFRIASNSAASSCERVNSSMFLFLAFLFLLLIPQEVPFWPVVKKYGFLIRFARPGVINHFLLYSFSMFMKPFGKRQVKRGSSDNCAE